MVRRYPSACRPPICFRFWLLPRAQVDRLAKPHQGAAMVEGGTRSASGPLLNERFALQSVGRLQADVSGENDWVGASRLRNATLSGSESSR